MAKVIIPARVGTVEPLRQVSGKAGQISVLTFTFADASVGAEDGGDIWFRTSLWGQHAEKLAPYIQKGASLLVEGQLKVSLFQKRDGSTAAQKEVLRPEITLMGSKKDAAPAPAAAPAEGGDFFEMPSGIEEEFSPFG